MKQFRKVTAGIVRNSAPMSSDGARREPRLVPVTDHIWVAHAYSLSNIIFIETATGVVAIDSGESVAAARRSLEDFRSRRGNLPIRHIIYTHSHGDHIRGASTLRSAETRIIAHRQLPEEHAKTQLLRAYRARVDRLQFGLHLEESQRGISHGKRGESGYIAPDFIFDSDYRFEEGGVHIELYHAPGESPDHVFVWLPDQGILFPGDNFYNSFPMLSSPMKPDRPVLQWANSLDRMRALRPRHLVPSHGLPLSGAEEIEETLANYAGAIRHVHDRTIELINRGFSVEEIKNRVRLPIHWRQLEYLQPRYGKVEWAIAGIYRQYTGWYDLKPHHLNPVLPGALSQALVKVSGVGPLLNRARALISIGHHQLGLELLEIVLEVRPNYRAALTLKAQALEELGRTATNRVEQNLYRSAALATQRRTATNLIHVAVDSHGDTRQHRCKPPVFILGIPRSHTSVICAMLGQHPQLYGVPELHLFGCPTMAEWFDLCRKMKFPRAHGLLRAVAQLYFGEQTDRTIELARRWLLARIRCRPEQVFRALGRRVYPRTVIEKSPSVDNSRGSLARMYREFPGARFIHLVRHPQGQGASVLNYLKVREQAGPIPELHWLRQMAGLARAEGGEPRPDPQHSWYRLNQGICTFLQSVPESQKQTLRSEELLREPATAFLPILQWLGLRTDPAALERIKHPEDSPYAYLGPSAAEFGNDRLFLQSPALRRITVTTSTLEGPPSWLSEDAALAPEVITLAKKFGYS